MTLRDLFTGYWTWLQLLREVAPMLIAMTATFWAGYWRGRRVEFGRWIKRLECLRFQGARANGYRSSESEREGNV